MKINVKNDTSIQIDNIPNEKIPSLHWLTLNGNEVPNIIDEIKKNIEYWSNIIEKDRLKFIVSCDSQRHGGKIVYVTTIVFLRKGLGGQGYFIREVSSIPGYKFHLENETKQDKIKRIQAIIQHRLWNECIKAVKCALWLDTVIEEYGLCVEEIHEDINSNKKYRSNDMLKSIVGYIEAVGFKPIIKPNAWVASTIADSKTK